jgi:hypothetical protein
MDEESTRGMFIPHYYARKYKLMDEESTGGMGFRQKLLFHR